MARKTTSRPGAQGDAGSVIDRMGLSGAIPPTPSEARPGSAVSLEMVNVFGEPVAEGAGSTQGTARAARLRLTAWVNNVSYVKDVWVDAYLIDPSGAVAHSETLVLDYREGAGGGGDFFVLDASIPSEGPGKPAVAGLQYRLYYQIGDTVYTEGILHQHSLRTPAPAAKPAPVATAKRSSEQTRAKAAPKVPAKPGAKVVAADDKASAKRAATAEAAPKKPPAPPAPGPGKPAKRPRPSA